MSDQENILINRVANSGLITINLEKYFPAEQMAIFDIKDYLFQGLILKEKDFRRALKDHDWKQYSGKILLVLCSTDAIVPVWAYMLVSAYGRPFAADVFAGTKEDYLKAYYYRIIKDMDIAEYKGQRIVIKGCSGKPVPVSAYLQLTEHLQPAAQSVMYGEPCSTVPIFKRPRELRKKE